MDILKIAIILAAVLCAMHAQADLPRCSSLRRELFAKFGAVFRDGRNVSGACDHLCVNNNRRVRRFYACCPGNTVFVPTGIPKSSRPLNADVMVVCQIPPPTTLPPTTAPPSTASNQLSSCPSGPTRLNHYRPASQERLCEYTCSVRLSIFGIPTGTRSRTVLRCCSGEPIVGSRALRLYDCPEVPEVPGGSDDQ